MRFLMLLVAFGLANSASAQVLIDPAGAGGFELGNDFASNGWTVSATNASQTNKWFVGTVPTGFTNRSAYISKDANASTWTYDMAPSVVHFYRTVTFPAGVPTFTLSFDWAAQGITFPFDDEIIVSLAPTSYTPTAASVIGFNNQLESPAISLGRFNNRGTKQHRDITISRDLGNCTFPSKWRLIFTWVNRGLSFDNPPAAIDNISLVGNPISVTINHPADQCAGLDDITYTATPVPSGGNTGVFSSAPVEAMVNYNEINLGNPISYFMLFGPPHPEFRGQGTFRASVVPPDDYTIIYTYTTPNCVFEVFDEITIIGAPSAALQDRVVDCVDPGEVIDLKVMFSDAPGDYITPGGSWKVDGVPLPNNDSTLVVPQMSICYTITYTVPTNNCGVSDEVTAKLLVELKSNPSFTIDDPNDNQPANEGGIFGCEGGNSSIGYIIQRTPTNNNEYAWEVRRDQVLIANGLGDLGGTLQIQPPGLNQTVCYSVCLTEYGDELDCTPGILDDIYNGSSYPNGYEPCAQTICQTIILYNDGNCDNGGANSTVFPSECDPDPFNPLFDVCETDPSPYLQLSCFLIKVKIPYKIVKATLTSEKCAIFCDDTEFNINYRSENVFSNIPGFNTRLQDMSPVTKVICKVLNFCICIPGVIRFKPLGSLGTWCDKTLADLVSEALEELAGSAGSGGMIVADTDGDGQFDFIIDDYDGINQSPAQSDPPKTGTVQNRISKKGGIITVRHVNGWPFKGINSCGDPTSESLNLLDVLAPYIDLIPIAGPVINGVLAAAQCDIPLAFTDAADIRIPVINSSLPEFKNCPAQTGYVFSEDYSCSTAVNWSIPIAEDGCLPMLAEQQRPLTRVIPGHHLHFLS